MLIIIVIISIPTIVSVTLLLIVSTSLSLYLYYTITGASCQALCCVCAQGFFCSTPLPGSQGAHARTRRLPTTTQYTTITTTYLLVYCVSYYLPLYIVQCTTTACVCIVQCTCMYVYAHSVVLLLVLCLSLCVYIAVRVALCLPLGAQLNAYLLGKPLTPCCPTMPTQIMVQYPQHSSPCSTPRTVSVSLGQSQCVYLSLFVVPTVQHITGCLSIGRSAQLLQSLFVQDVYHANQGPRTRTRPSVSIAHTSLCVLLFLYYLFTHIVMSMSMCLIMCYSSSLGHCVCMYVCGAIAQGSTYGTLSLSARGPTYLRTFHRLEPGGVLWEKFFFLCSNHYPLSKTPTKSISDFGLRENTKNGSHTLPHSGIKYGKPVSVNLL